MAKHDVVSIAQDDWVQLTDDDATTVTFQVREGYVAIVPTTAASEPANTDGAIFYGQGQGELGAAMTSVAPGISAVRLYGKAIGGTAKVFISHD